MKNVNLYCAAYTIILAFTVSGAFAQPLTVSWTKTFGGMNADACENVLQTPDGGYILVGSTESFGAGESDCWMVKTDSLGNIIWSRTFGGFSWDWCEAIQQTSDGGFVLAGYTFLYGPEYGYGWLLKTNANGDSLWGNIYQGNTNQEFYSIQETSDGGFIIGGRGFIAIMKTDANGDSLWGHAYAANGSEVCHSVKQLDDGGYILAGKKFYGVSRSYFWLARTDENGNPIWDRTYGGVQDDVCYDVIQTSDGGFIAAGYTYSFGAGVYDFWLLKTNEDGDSLWSCTYGGYEKEECYMLFQTSDSGFILAGRTESFGHGYHESPDLWLVRTDANGDSLWSWVYGDANYNQCNCIRRTQDDGFMLVGTTGWPNLGSDEYWMIKTGPELLAEPYKHPLPAEYILYQNYPNPFNPTTQIHFDLTKASYISLKVFDVLGREVQVLANDIQPVGSHSIVFNGAELPSGVYLYRLQAGDYIAIKKMVLLK